MAEDESSFVSRWSRRKRERDLTAEAKPEAPLAERAEGEGPQTEAEVEELVKSLPDIETMTEESDFTVFLQKGIPQELKQRALRRLWRLNPIFANLDGLNDYDDDFTDAALVVKNLKTLYEVGKGMPDPKKPEEEEEEAETAEAESLEESGAETEDGDDSKPESRSQDETAEAEDSAPSQVEHKDFAQLAEPVAQTPRPKGQAARRRWGA